MSKSKKTSTSRSKIGKKELRSTVSHYLSLHPGDYFTPKQLFKALKFTTHPLKMLCIDVLNEMIDSQDIVVNEDGEFSYNGRAQVCEGVFTRTSGGRNFVDLPDGAGVSVYDDDTLHALPGDKVKVSLFAKKRGSDKIHGQVIEILKRNEKPFIGNLQVGKQFAFLVNPDGSLPHDILIPIDKLKGGHTGEKALVKVTSWPENARNPIGEVVDILGESGNNDTEMHAILAEFGLPYRYPESVELAANKIEPGITPEEIAKREDFRNVLTFTIDPRDAKDFDDALSIRKVKAGVWEVGVHIADVSHYVLEGSIIDKEAQKRATSVYLVDRTIPMLPERLCNFICSLRPDEEKLSYSVVFEMNEESVTHKQLPRQAKKAQGIAEAAMIVGALAGARGTYSAGLAGSRTEMTTEFARVRRVKVFPRRGLIKVNQLLSKNQVYAAPEDFEFVRDYILQHVPEKARPKQFRENNKE